MIATLIRYAAPRRAPQPCAACAFHRRITILIWELRPFQIWCAVCAFHRKVTSRSRPKVTSRSLSSPKAGAARSHLPRPLPQRSSARSHLPRPLPQRPLVRPLVRPCHPGRSMTGDQAKRRARRHRDRPCNMSAPTGADPRDEKFHPQPEQISFDRSLGTQHYVVRDLPSRRLYIIMRVLFIIVLA